MCHATATSSWDKDWSRNELMLDLATACNELRVLPADIVLHTAIGSCELDRWVRGLFVGIETLSHPERCVDRHLLKELGTTIQRQATETDEDLRRQAIVASTVLQALLLARMCHTGPLDDILSSGRAQGFCGPEDRCADCRTAIDRAVP